MVAHAEAVSKGSRQSTEYWRWAAALGPAVALYWAPLPGLNAQQRHLLAIFTGTILAMMTQPMPVGACAFSAITALALTNTLPAARVLSGFANPVTWLIFSAFLFARAVISTGLGLRTAYWITQRFGGHPITLGYSVAASNVALAPFIPSDTARGGGVLYPITRSLARCFDSEPGPTGGRMGAYLNLVGFHVNYVASATFLTSMAANPMIASFARKIAKADITWGTWLLGSSLPALLSLLLVPVLLYWLQPPSIKDMGPARRMAAGKLAEMGPMSRQEWILVVILFSVMAGWVTSNLHWVSNALVAVAGVTALLLCRIVTWDELLEQRGAWDALVWFAPILMMSDALLETGVVGVLSGALFAPIGAMTVAPAFLVLTGAYFYAHYGFASQTAHATALYPGFLTAAVGVGIPPMVAALALAFLSSLDAGITHYGTGSAPVYFGAGFVSQGTWWRVGFCVSVLNLLIWLGIGPLWWKAAGLW